MKWTVNSASGDSFAEVGDSFSGNGAGGEPHIDATCKNPANTVLWETALVAETANGYKGKMSNNFEFVIVFDGSNVFCELVLPPTPQRPEGGSGTWSGDDN